MVIFEYQLKIIMVLSYGMLLSLVAEFYKNGIQHYVHFVTGVVRKLQGQSYRFVIFDLA